MTRVVSLSRHGAYVVVEVWTNHPRERFRITFDRYRNVTSIQRWLLDGEGLPSHLRHWKWQQEFHRAYKRKRSLKSIHVDAVVTAIQGVKDHGHRVAHKETLLTRGL